MSAWSEEEDRLFEAVSSGDLGAVRSYLAGNGSADPEMFWEPGPDQLDDSRLAKAARFWESVRVGEDLPDYSAFGPEDLKPLLGHLAIIESLGADFRYRLYGSYITARYGEDRTGQFICEKNAGMA